MSTDILLNKPDPTLPWGFRLTGGANFDLPLTTIKVNDEGIAAKCGLSVGDIILKINDDDIANFTHAQAHNKIVESGEQLKFTVVRSEISEAIQAMIQDDDSNAEMFNILEASVPVDYPEQTYDIRINDLIGEDERPQHDLNLPHEEIHGILNQNGPSEEANEAINNGHSDSKMADNLIHSDVLNEINHNDLQESEKKWSTFLQKPHRPSPIANTNFEVPKSTYKVIIRTKKDLEAERKAKIEAELLAALAEEEQENQLENEIDLHSLDISGPGNESEIAAGIDELKPDEENQDNLDLLEENSKSAEEPLEINLTISEPDQSFQEDMRSLENKLGIVKNELEHCNVEMVPESLQKTLALIAAQLEKIVKIAKGPINKDTTEVSKDVTEIDQLTYSELPAIAPSDQVVAGNEANVKMSEDGTQDASELSQSDNAGDNAECDRTDFDVTEMQDYQEEVPVDDPAEAPLVDAQDEQRTSKKEKIANWNRIWPWTQVTQPIYRESNCCMVPRNSSQKSKINFLKYQPPPKNLDHLINSDVYKMVHNMDGEPKKGICTRPAKVAVTPLSHVNINSESTLDQAQMGR